MMGVDAPYKLMMVAWGDVPEWLSSVATVFALVFAAAAVVAARRTFRIESERDRINMEARRTQEAFARSAQAALVSAWWGESGQEGRSGAFVRNASGAPVYQVHLTVLGSDDHSDGAKAHFLVVPPRKEAEFCSVDLPADRNQPIQAGRTVHRVKLSFTDAAGVRWTRNQYGRLTELKPNLRIKVDSARAEVLAQFDDDFLATYGVTITYETDVADYPQSKFLAEVRTPSVADALIGPHDWVGDLIRQAVIEPTVLSADHRDAFPAWALTALTFDKRLYGLPMTTDTVALIRNTTLAPRPPATFEELVSTGEALRDAGQVAEVLAIRISESGDPFQIWPLFSSGGGWLFGRTADGDWDPTQIGLATPESIAAFARLRALGEAGSGILRRSMDRTEALELFATGRSAYLISSSDGLRHARQAGVPLEVSAVPPFADGEPAVAFSLVHGLLMAKHGVNKAIAHDLFADYLTHASIMAALSTGVVSPVALLTTAAEDAAIGQYQLLCEAGTPMPSFPQMEQVWRILGTAEAAVIAGASAEATARDAALQLTTAFAA